MEVLRGVPAGAGGLRPPGAGGGRGAPPDVHPISAAALHPTALSRRSCRGAVPSPRPLNVTPVVAQCVREFVPRQLRIHLLDCKQTRGVQNKRSAVPQYTGIASGPATDEPWQPVIIRQTLYYPLYVLYSSNRVRSVVGAEALFGASSPDPTTLEGAQHGGAAAASDRAGGAPDGRSHGRATRAPAGVNPPAFAANPPSAGVNPTPGCLDLCRMTRGVKS
eukprot:1195528-Prorocentrum_minimum.AAC.1